MRPDHRRRLDVDLRELEHALTGPSVEIYLPSALRNMNFEWWKPRSLPLLTKVWAFSMGRSL